MKKHRSCRMKPQGVYPRFSGVCCEGCLEENGYHGEKMDRSDSDKEE